MLWVSRFLMCVPSVAREGAVGQLGSPKKVKDEEVMLELRLEVGVRVCPEGQVDIAGLREHGVQKPKGMRE